MALLVQVQPGPPPAVSPIRLTYAVEVGDWFFIKDKRELTAVAIVSRRVGAGIERPVGSAAVGKKSAKRNELGNPNGTLEHFLV